MSYLITNNDICYSLKFNATSFEVIDVEQSRRFVYSWSPTVASDNVYRIGSSLESIPKKTFAEKLRAHVENKSTELTEFDFKYIESDCRLDITMTIKNSLKPNEKYRLASYAADFGDFNRFEHRLEYTNQKFREQSDKLDALNKNWLEYTNQKFREQSDELAALQRNYLELMQRLEELEKKLKN
jgi:hypothetical protein